MTRAMIRDRELRAAIEFAVRAPSIHNTQPWRWRITETGLQLWLDRDRLLPATDPDGHGAVLSCGAALRLARLSIRAQGWRADVIEDLDPAEPDRLATLTVTGPAYADPHSGELVALAHTRVSDRRLLDADGIPRARLEDLATRASEPDAFVDLVLPTDTDAGIWLAVFTAQATRAEEADPAQLDELRQWVRQDVPADDGVPQWAVPATGPQPRHGNVAQRRFAAPGQAGGLAIPGGVDEHPAFAVVMTPTDTRQAHLRAGETTMQLMLEATAAGISSCPVSQPVDHVGDRLRLGQALGGVAVPQMVLRLGTPRERDALPPTPRRPVDDTLDT